MGGIDELAVDTVGKFNEVGVVGSLFVLLVILIWFREFKYWPRQIEKLEAEKQRSYDAHDKTRDALLAEVRSGSETLVLVREQLKAMSATVEDFRKMVAELLRTGRSGGGQ